MIWRSWPVVVTIVFLVLVFILAVLHLAHFNISLGFG